MHPENLNLTCPLCTQTNDCPRLMVMTNPRKSIDHPTFAYYRCPNCTFLILDPHLTSEEQTKIYDAPEYHTDLSQPVKNSFLNKVLNLKIFKSYEQYVQQWSENKKKLLDIGCGNGEFALSMKNKGYDVYGMDPYPQAVQRTSAKIGAERVFSGFIKDLTQQFEIITMWHVLEHTDPPSSDLQVISSKLTANGKFIFEVPSADSFNFLLFKDNYAWKMIPEHGIYFTLQSIKQILPTYGFAIQNIYTPPRALLNFALSLKNIHHSKLLFILTIPISIILGIITAYLNRGEVIRVVAQKI
jgi:SAM-dependent methyltransferase